MGFFTALAPLLRRGSLTLRISDVEAGKVRLIILQDSRKGGQAEEAVPLPPLRYVDTPEALDGKLEIELAELLAWREGPVQSVLEEAKAQMAEAAAEEKRKSAERLAAARSKSGKAKAATTDKTDTPEEAEDANASAAKTGGATQDLFA